MNYRTVLLRGVRICGACLALTLMGCYAPDKSRNRGEKPVVPAEYYVHCDTCVWCHGPYRKYQEAEKISRDHNLKKHDFMRVAYYDSLKCSK